MLNRPALGSLRSVKVAVQRVQVAEGSQAEARTELDFGAIQKVLVVDDSRLQRRILVASLKKWGFEVLEADSGDVAIGM